MIKCVKYCPLIDSKSEHRNDIKKIEINFILIDYFNYLNYIKSCKMNLFILSFIQKEIAEYMMDKHVSKYYLRQFKCFVLQNEY